MGRKKEIEFILASASPRRKELLERAGYNFKVIPSEIDESELEKGRNVIEHAKKLALAKAKDVAARFPDLLVMGADTVVDFDGETIGKAFDAKDAEQIVRRLFSRPHKVITAVALVRLSDGNEIVNADTTVVYPRPMNEEQIAEHIKSQSWQGKAGSYAIQQGGDRFIEKLEGSYSNVMGLPMEMVKRMLEEIRG
jgi:septum formation protein